MRKINQLALFLGIICGLVQAPLWAGNKKAEKLVAQGKQAEARRDFDAALGLFERALASDPSDAAYLLHVRRARFAASQAHVDTGQNLRAGGKLEEALAEFQKAYAIDPASAIAEQEMRRTYQMIDREKKKQGRPGAPPSTPEERALTPADQARRDAERRAARIQPLPQLKPISRKVAGLKMVNQPAKVLYETLGKLAGINVLVDAEFQDTKRYTIDLSNTTLDEALDYLSLITKTYYKPLSANAIFVTQDNVTKRRDYEDFVTRIFYLQNVTSTQELQEVMTAMRTVTDVRKVFPVNSQSAIVVRGTADQVALAEKVLLDLDKPKPEVIVDLLVMEANRSKTRDLALTPLSGGKPGLGSPIAFTGGASSDSGGSTGAVALNKLRNLTAGDWSVVVPSFLVQALMSDRQTRVLTTPQVRATDGQKATLRLGDRYPYATGSFQPGIGAVGVSPLVSTQFQFAEVGVNVDVTPRIHGNDEVSMQVEFEISNIRDRVDVGGLSQPIIGQRKVSHIIRVKEGEVTLIGGLMQANVSRTRTGVPFLMNIPGVGRLFSSENIDNTDSDLLVALVPHIVRSPEISAESVRAVASGVDQIYRLNLAPEEDSAGEEKPAGPAARPAAPVRSPLVPGIPAQPKPAAAPAATLPAAGPPPAPPEAKPEAEAPSLTRPGAPSSGPILSLLASTAQPALNSTFTVSLQIDNVADLFSSPLRIRYDNKIVRLVGVQRGSFLGSDGQQVTFSDSRDEGSGAVIINMNRVPGAGGISGSGVLVEFKFQAVEKGVSTIRIEDATLRDARLEPIAATPPSIAVTVQ